MPFALNGTCRLYWRQDGSAGKHGLLLLNSIGTDMGLWDRVVPLLAERFRIIRMDTRGHGASDAPDGPYTLDLLAEDACSVLDAAGLLSAFVCGVSLGGMIAMRLALKAPDRVGKLVLACTSAQLDRAAWQARIDTVLQSGPAAIVDLAMQRFFCERFRKTHPEIVEPIRTAFLAANSKGYAGCCAAIRDMALLSALPQIRVPTLVIAGTRDVTTPFEGHGNAIAKAIPGVQATLIDAAHLACLEAPSAFASAVAKFLDGGKTQEAQQVLYEEGLKTRRKVLGDVWVDNTLKSRTALNTEFQEMITRYAWNEIWSRPGLDHRTRRLLVLAITASLGRWEEFRLHLKAGLEQGGVTLDEVKETLMQTAIYAGVPAANTAFAEAAALLKERP